MTFRAVFGEGGVRLFVAGAALRDILGDSRSAKCCLFYTESSPRSHGEGLRSGGCEMMILSSDIVGLSSDIVRLSSNRLYIGGSNSGLLR